MLGVNRYDVEDVAKRLQKLHMSLTDPSGQRVLGNFDMTQYPIAIMAALVQLSGGEAIGYQGDTHIRMPLGTEHLTLQYEKTDKKAEKK